MVKLIFHCVLHFTCPKYRCFW